MRDFVLMVAYAMCSPNPEVTVYDDYSTELRFADEAECVSAAKSRAADHAYCTPLYFAPEKSIRPQPRRD